MVDDFSYAGQRIRGLRDTSGACNNDPTTGQHSVSRYSRQAVLSGCTAISITNVYFLQFSLIFLSCSASGRIVHKRHIKLNGNK